MGTKKIVVALLVVVVLIAGTVFVQGILYNDNDNGGSLFTCEQYPVYPEDFRDWEHEAVVQTEYTNIGVFRSSSEMGLVREVVTTHVKFDAEETWHLFLYQYTVGGEICICVPPPPKVRESRTTITTLPGNQKI